MEFVILSLGWLSQTNFVQFENEQVLAMFFVQLFCVIAEWLLTRYSRAKSFGGFAIFTETRLLLFAFSIFLQQAFTFLLVLAFFLFLQQAFCHKIQVLCLCDECLAYLNLFIQGSYLDSSQKISGFHFFVFLLFLLVYWLIECIHKDQKISKTCANHERPVEWKCSYVLIDALTLFHFFFWHAEVFPVLYLMFICFLLFLFWLFDQEYQLGLIDQKFIISHWKHDDWKRLR